MKNRLLRYYFVKILPFEDAFYYTEKLPKKVKLTKDLLRLNYLKYSPYKTAQILSTIKDENLMLWFYGKEIKAKSVIPESYLLFLELKKQKIDGLFILKDNNYKIIIIKDGKLLSAYTLKELDKEIINLSLHEHQITEYIEFDYKMLYKKAIDNISLKEIYDFNQLSLDKKAFFSKLINKIAYPISFFLIFTMGLNYLHGYYIDKEIDKNQKLYQDIKQKNKKINESIKKHNKNVKLWNKFANKELVYPDLMEILKSLSSINQKGETVFLRDLSINGSIMQLRLRSNMNPVIFLNRLSSIKYFDRVVIAAVHKPRKDLKIITYNIDIKKLDSK